jgi:hypothetical protein
MGRLQAGRSKNQGSIFSKAKRILFVTQNPREKLGPIRLTMQCALGLLPGGKAIGAWSSPITSIRYEVTKGWDRPGWCRANALELYSEVPWLESLLGHRQHWLRFLMLFSDTKGKYCDNILIMPRLHRSMFFFSHRITTIILPSDAV